MFQNEPTETIMLYISINIIKQNNKTKNAKKKNFEKKKKFAKQNSQN